MKQICLGELRNVVAAAKLGFEMRESLNYVLSQLSLTAIALEQVLPSLMAFAFCLSLCLWYEVPTSMAVKSFIRNVTRSKPSGGHPLCSEYLMVEERE
jgi:hypothetical protein